MALLVHWESMENVFDVLGVLGDDRVVRVVLRVLVSWQKEGRFCLI